MVDDQPTNGPASDPACPQGLVVWFTGLSGSGKSTLAGLLKSRLQNAGHCVMVLDGDVVRTGLCRGLGFSEEDRRENIRRVAEVARLAADSGMVCLVALVSPFQSARQQARAIIGGHQFIEVYLSAPLSECERRDVKGLYAQARAGQVPSMTGLASPYEVPATPDLILDTALLSTGECMSRLIAAMAQRGLPLA